MASHVNLSSTLQLSSNIDESWCDRHVIQSQYALQTVRCNSKDCCGEWRSNFLQIFPQRFLLPSIPFARSSADLIITSNDAEQGAFYGSLFQRLQLNKFVREEIKVSQFPFDLFCTTVKQSLSKRTCKTCNQYFPSIERMKNHSEIHKLTKMVVEAQISSSDEDENEPKSQSADMLSDKQMINICIIHNLNEWLKPIFEEI